MKPESDKDITTFKGKNERLSNFYPSVVTYEGIRFPTVEHAFQAAKSKDRFIHKTISNIPADQPGKAKRAGRRIVLRKDWEMIKISIMRYLLTQKFNHPEFKEFLLSTGNRKLIEGNYWHDNYWGDCYCNKCTNIIGKNNLGKLLMKIRGSLI